MAKKKKGIRNIIIVTVVSLTAFSVLFYYLQVNRPGSFAHYSGFGIDLPEDYSIHGIDVSRYQGAISWNLVKEMREKDIRITFAFIKATEGSNNVDPEFRRNWRGARKAGILRGAYHYFIASQNGKQQAELFISKVNADPGDLPPVLDVEESNGTPVNLLRENVKAWLNTIEFYYKVKPVIYTNIDFYSSYLSGVFDNYPLWVAHYKVQHQPRISRRWSFWQHNDAGRVNGIANKVDFNVFNGDSIELNNLLIQQ